MPLLPVALATLAAAAPCQDPAAGLQCPDLIMLQPSGLRIERFNGRRLLRMANRIVNVGLGPAELYGTRTGPREMAARQVVADAAGVRRRYDSDAELYYTSVPTRGGDYWKMDDAARFELWQLDDLGQRVGRTRVGPKLRYCLRDLQLLRPTPLSPPQRVFGACNQSPTRRDVTVGTSVGWADVYPAGYPGNHIDVTGLVGCFLIVHRVDPLNGIAELDEENNSSQVLVRLPYEPGAPGCPAPVA